MPSHLCKDCSVEVQRKGRCKPCGKIYAQVWDRAYSKRHTKALKETAQGLAQLKKSRDKRRARHRLLIFEEKNKPCVDCGKTYHHSLMDFDHRPDEIKKFAVASMKIQSIKLISIEIAKCDLVCCLCHRRRTWNRVHPNDLISQT